MTHRKPLTALVALMTLICLSLPAAASVAVKDLRHFSASDHTRVVLELSGVTNFNSSN